eukprot:TRINITY_DN2087_c0_g1_i3.p1 TRINITY_DN2087_c0_g1~~TRINITY_DN2087_c0_g1_i3.p1  ORF type:complete len:487 (+),score=82.88 TRINITY_DN2087_c0_g1_i3:91-1551(+)
MAFYWAPAVLALLAATSVSQKIGTHVQEAHPPLEMSTCTASGCTTEMKSIVLDSNWRWVHNGQYTNCYKDGAWVESLCPDPETCAKNCHIDGATVADYKDTYGISTSGNELDLGFVVETKYGTNFGSRVYLLENEHAYKMFHLKNREFSVDVDMARMPCGLNGAIYFVEMDADGGQSRSKGLNEAGAGYGTGYCDAQCPHDMKFINGLANTVDWNSTSDPPVGKAGICCAEMDIWEANSRANAYTPHTCSIKGTYICEGVECGDNEKDHRYDGVCDKDGCDFNPWRMGNHTFYGRGKRFVTDSTKKLTVVTQFITSDSTDDGDLVEIRRFYVQDGKIIPNSESSMVGVAGNSLTDEFCHDMKNAFGDIDDFNLKGGMKAMGEALDRGLVLVMSIWDDPLANMLWLDSDYPLNKKPSTPGVNRGPCKTDTGSPAYLRKKYPGASVRYSDIKIGAIGTTFGSTTGDGDAHGDDAGYGSDRRLDGSTYV